MNNNYTYEADWRKHAYEPQKAKFATKDEVAAAFSPVCFADKTKTHGGVPIISDGTNGVVIDNENMTLVFGATGSGKTRVLASQIICSLAKAGESMIIVDQKGSFSSGTDLAPYVRGTLKEQGYKPKFLDFKDFCSDGMSILGPVYTLYNEKNTSEAKRYVDKLLKNLLGSRLTDNPRDAMWTNLAVQYIKSIIMLITAYAKNASEVNFMSVKHFMNVHDAKVLANVLKHLRLDESTADDLKNVCTAHHNGITSVMITAAEMLAPLTSNERLLKMTCYNTFKVEDLYKEKTALFIILPEDGTYNFAASMVLGIILDKLNDVAYRSKESKLPRRLNIVADEFPNYTLDKMKTRISTDRSKNIRWYLFCQGLKQLEKSYPNDFETIIANCNNQFYLGSPEQELLERLSEGSGKRTDNPAGWEKPLVSVQDLRGLKKTACGKQVYFTDGHMHYVSTLPDISKYSSFYHNTITDYRLTNYRYPDVGDFTMNKLRRLVAGTNRLIDSQFDVQDDD